MEFTLNPRRADPHDVPVVPPDVVPVAHGDAEFPNLAPGGTGRPSATQARAEPDFSADPPFPSPPLQRAACSPTLPLSQSAAA